MNYGASGKKVDAGKRIPRVNWQRRDTSVGKKRLSELSIGLTKFLLSPTKAHFLGAKSAPAIPLSQVVNL